LHLCTTHVPFSLFQYFAPVIVRNKRMRFADFRFAMASLFEAHRRLYSVGVYWVEQTESTVEQHGPPTSRLALVDRY
jgi:hypothetical protein